MFPYVCSYYVSYVFHGQVCFTPPEISYAEEPCVGLLLSALEEEDLYAEESCVLSDPRLAWRGFPWISPPAEGRQKPGGNYVVICFLMSSFIFLMRARREHGEEKLHGQ